MTINAASLWDPVASASEKLLALLVAVRAWDSTILLIRMTFTSFDQRPAEKGWRHKDKHTVPRPGVSPSLILARQCLR